MQNNLNRCCVCKGSATFQPKNLGYFVNCSICGKYTISDIVFEDKMIESLDNKHLGLLRGFLFNELIPDKYINSKLLSDLNNKESPTVVFKARSLLKYLEKTNDSLGFLFNVDEMMEKLISCCFSTSKFEVEYIIKDMLQREYGYVERDTSKTRTMADPIISIKITPKGWAFLGESTPRVSSIKKIFCAMWFDKSMNSFYDQILSPIILECGYDPIRIDLKPHNNKICDEIISEIKDSKAMIADFTGHRGGVYFEAGYAYALGIPTIFTCSNEDFGNIHFDIRQFNFLTWDESSFDEFRKGLTLRIKSTIK